MNIITIRKIKPPFHPCLTGIVMAIGLLFSAAGVWAKSSRKAETIRQPFASYLSESYQQFYQPRGLIYLSSAFALGSVIANTQMDQSIRDWYQQSARSSTIDHIAKTFKFFGNNKDAAILFLSTSGAAMILHRTPMGTGLSRYSQRYLQALLVGLPPLLITQNLTGGNRPGTTQGSSWRPMKHDQGVSGHAFLGSLPFLTAANMIQQPLLKGVLYGSSILTGLSRINDDKHFASQVALGWYLGYMSVHAVFHAESASSVHISPVMYTQGGAGVSISKSL